MKIGLLLAHLCELEATLAGDLRRAAERHRDDHDIYHQCLTFSVTAHQRLEKLEPLTLRFDGEATWSSAVGEGSNDLLEDLRTLYLRTLETSITWVMASQAAKAARDQQLLTLATECQSQTETQARWFTTRIKTGAPQALVFG
jgi:hypothetical protein